MRHYVDSFSIRYGSYMWREFQQNILLYMFLAVISSQDSFILFYFLFYLVIIVLGGGCGSTLIKKCGMSHYCISIRCNGKYAREKETHTKKFPEFYIEKKYFHSNKRKTHFWSERFAQYTKPQLVSFLSALHRNKLINISPLRCVYTCLATCSSMPWPYAEQLTFTCVTCSRMPWSNTKQPILSTPNFSCARGQQ